MKKFFLIPLMTLVCSVMAWGATISVGEGGDQTSLAAAINAASAGDKLQLVSNLTVSSEVNFNKALTVDFNSYTITATGNWLIVVNANLTLEATNGGGITAPKGCLDVYGSSKVTINGGTFTTSITNSGAAIWGNGSSCELEFNNGTINAQSAGIVYEGGRVIINGGNFNGEYGGALEVKGGYFEINDGEFISHCSTTHMGSNWAYAVIADNCTFVMNGGHIEGVQGGLSIGEDCAGTINNGEIETRHGVDGQHNNHYALYVSTGAVVNVYDGKFKVETPSMGGNRVVLIGNNDAYNYYGVVNMYGGKYQEKAYVTKQKNAESHFPASVPLTSAWYTAFQEKDAANAFAPLPAGYEYYDITEGEDYEAGYRYGVRPVAGKEADAINPAQQAEQEADPTYTIPWQQATTWATDAVPEENTIVTIPVDATVTVSKDEAEKEAVADQVYVAQGATLKVEEGTTLTIGDGGMNIGNGGQIVVEAGATVKIGSAGVITSEEEALVIESNDDVQGVLLYEPSVAENTQPKATVKLTTKAKQIGANSYVFERFAIPTVNGSATTYSIEGGIPTSGLYNDAPSFLQAVWEWNNATDEWEQLDKFKDMQPFHGYQLTNNSAAGGLVYVFEGNLVGNQPKDYEFVENGFHFFGNSYSADINIKSFLNSLGADVEKTVWVYDPYDKTFKTITERMANGRVKYGNGEAIKDVRSMQAFLMYLSDGESGTAQVDYSSAIWGNPKYGNSVAPAPARQAKVAEDWVTIRVSAANGLKDEVILNQSEEFTAAFENGADANKFMNKENINLYAATNAGNLAVVATNDLNNTVLTFAAGNASEYTLQFADIEGYEFTLRDNVTGANVLMTEGATYTFNQEANTTIPARFEVLGAPKVMTDIDNVEAAAKANGIYTITGQFLGHDFTNLPAGVYVVNGVKIVK